jgi:serine/threonine protein kinase
MADGVTLLGIDVNTVLEALKKHCPDRNIKVVNEYEAPSNSDVHVLNNEDSAKDVEIARIGKLLAAKETQMKEMEVNTKIAVQSIQTFHQQQQALYEEFKTLRTKYDEQKLTLMTTLWTHTVAHNPELRFIPKEVGPNFIDTETQVGDYSVGDALGEGQFATVYSCTSKHAPDIQFALKVLKKERISNFSSLRRVSNEIETLKKLNSDYMIKIVECIHTPKHLYIVTEMGGQDMFEFFDEHPDGVPESWAKEIVSGILEAVYHCHKNLICHRDLKPENVLLHFDIHQQKCKDIKLCDFGLSTKYEPGMRLSDFCGSPGFFAPEMITEGAYDGEKIDVWSVGCILLELVLGHERFCDVWMSSYELEVMRDKARFFDDISASVNYLPNVLDFSPELSDFIVSILTVDSKDRPSSAAICQHPWMKSKFKRHLEGEEGDDVHDNLPVFHSERVTGGSGATSSTHMRMAAREREFQHGDDGKRGSMTPSVVTARKIMEKGNRLARLASNNYEETHFDDDDDQGDAI